jgi:1-acyl-sn-glycerol-3-phosphate acyltransferase
MFQKKLMPLYKVVQKSFSIQITGLENIQRDQNYIFAMNHLSIMDIPISYAILAPQTDRKINLFLSHIFYNLFFPLTLPLDAISINMNKGKSPRAIRHNRSQLEIGIHKLQEGNSVLIYPEGGMPGAKDSIVTRGETGAVRLAVRTGTAVIPIGVKGSNHAYPFTVYTNNPFAYQGKIPIEVTIGEPISYQNYSHLDLVDFSTENRSILRLLTEELMVILSRLSGLPQISQV